MIMSFRRKGGGVSVTRCHSMTLTSVLDIGSFLSFHQLMSFVSPSRWSSRDEIHPPSGLFLSFFVVALVLFMSWFSHLFSIRLRPSLFFSLFPPIVCVGHPLSLPSFLSPWSFLIIIVIFLRNKTHSILVWSSLHYPLIISDTVGCFCSSRPQIAPSWVPSPRLVAYAPCGGSSHWLIPHTRLAGVW